jgi:hypothetical protein
MAERACSLSGLANIVRTLWAKSSADGADTPFPICVLPPLIPAQLGLRNAQNGGELRLGSPIAGGPNEISDAIDHRVSWWRKYA